MNYRKMELKIGRKWLKNLNKTGKSNGRDNETSKFMVIWKYREQRQPFWFHFQESSALPGDESPSQAFIEKRKKK